MQIAQGLHTQLAALPGIRNTALERASMTAAPGVAARNCRQHVTFGDDDGVLGRRIRSGPSATAYSYYELVWSWMQGASPSVLLAGSAAGYVGRTGSGFDLQRASAGGARVARGGGGIERQLSAERSGGAGIDRRHFRRESRRGDGYGYVGSVALTLGEWK